MKKNMIGFVAAVVTVVLASPAMGQAVTVSKSELDDLASSVREFGTKFSTLEATVKGYGTRLNAVEQAHRVAVAAPAPAPASATGSPLAPAPRAVLDSERDASALRAVSLEVGEIKNHFESSSLEASDASNRLGRLEDIARVYYCAGSPPSDAMRLCVDIATAQDMGKHRLNRLLHPNVYGPVIAVAPPEETIAHYSATRCVLPAAIGAIGAGIMALAAPPNRAAQNEVWVGVGVGAVVGIVSAVVSDGGVKRFQDGLLSAGCGFAGAGGVALGDTAIRPDGRRDVRANVVVVR